MRIIRVHTDDAVREQWRVLLRFSYDRNICAVFTEFGHVAPTADVLASVAGAVRQSHAYFDAAAVAPLDISPLLLYYGASNLLGAVSVLRSGAPSPIQHHGMRLDPPAAGAEIGDAAFVTLDPNQGALGAFAKLASVPLAARPGVRWTMRDVLATIPDIGGHFDWPYVAHPPAVLPVHPARREHETVDRILIADFGNRDPRTTLADVPRFRDAYLRPHVGYDWVVLFRRRGGIDVCEYSLMGQRHLGLGVPKQGNIVRLPQSLSYFMALYVLAMLSRYHAAVWHPFVRTDTTGERGLVERFVEAARRLIPRLALELLYDARWIFDSRPPEEEDARERLAAEDVEQIVRRERGRLDEEFGDE